MRCVAKAILLTLLCDAFLYLVIAPVTRQCCLLLYGIWLGAEQFRGAFCGFGLHHVPGGLRKPMSPLLLSICDGMSVDLAKSRFMMVPDKRAESRCWSVGRGRPNAGD